MRLQRLPRRGACLRRAGAARRAAGLGHVFMKKYLIAGLLVWLPLAVTIWVLHAVLGLVGDMFGWVLTASQTILPASAHAPLEALRKVPGLGLVVVVMLLLGTGVFAANMVGQWWLRQGGRILHRIPVVKSIYSCVKQVSDTLFSSQRQRVSQGGAGAVPAPGLVDHRLPDRPARRRGRHSTWCGDYLSVYVPTTPNPTSGYFLMVPRADVIELDMSVDEALKYIISMGVVAP